MSLQPVCLATFSQVRSISCSAEVDGRALLTVHIEGAKQVTQRHFGGLCWSSRPSRVVWRNFSIFRVRQHFAVHTNTEYLVCLTPQPLSVNTSSLAVAENMADLIDGHCRLKSNSESSLINRPNKGTLHLHSFKKTFVWDATVNKLIWFLQGETQDWNCLTSRNRECHDTQ